MHRQIMDPPKGKVVDHKNRNRLDNTRINLRVCTHAENTQNARNIQGTYSRYKGVSYRRGHSVLRPFDSRPATCGRVGRVDCYSIRSTVVVPSMAIFAVMGSLC